MWYDEAVVYQIYPLGLCGAPLQNDGDQSQADNHRILRVLDWVEHIKRLGATCVLFNPLFESDAHGYDTRDYNKVDCRLGTNDDLRQVCAALHAAGIKILFDGVFNHVGRGFWAFKDVQEKRWDSPYKDWFHISFDGNTNYNDGFWYEAWEGCNELVKLNLQNPAVKNYLFDVVRGWVRDYDIDGLRLDVAYCLDLGFLAELRGLADEIAALSPQQRRQLVEAKQAFQAEREQVLEAVMAARFALASCRRLGPEHHLTADAEIKAMREGIKRLHRTVITSTATRASIKADTARLQAFGRQAQDLATGLRSEENVVDDSEDNSGGSSSQDGASANQMTESNSVESVVPTIQANCPEAGLRPARVARGPQPCDDSHARWPLSCGPAPRHGPVAPTRSFIDRGRRA